jgi:hypothetical protein
MAGAKRFQQTEAVLRSLIESPPPGITLPSIRIPVRLHHTRDSLSAPRVRFSRFRVACRISTELIVWSDCRSTTDLRDSRQERAIRA